MIRPNKKKINICKTCIFDETTDGIYFNKVGRCNYCLLVDEMKALYGTGQEKGIKEFDKIVSEIKQNGIGKPYDIVIGVSGGTDSSYMLYLAKEYGLRPLAVHYDNTWNSAIATLNIQKITSALDIDLYTHVCDNAEADDIFRSFFLASVPEIDGPTDIALAEVMYRAAAKYQIKYVFEGHSFITEGIAPMARAYVDGGYIKNIHKKFGKLPMKTFPNMSFLKFLYWTLIKNIKKIRPLWYLDYSKEAARKFLEDNFGWEYYGGHHLENRMTAFHHSYYTPSKFGLDQRNNTLSAKVRSGHLSQKEALQLYAKPLYVEAGLLPYVKKRLEITDQRFEEIMSREKKYYTDYKSYKKRFELLRPLFKILADHQLVPMSFYKKYCFPAK